MIQPQADGWMRSFEASSGKLVWNFDTNRKGAKWDWTDNSGGSKHVVVATPVYAEGKIYFAVGRDHEFAGTDGHLFCVDPNRRGDISPELDDGHGKGKPNPNSGMVWDFTKDAGSETAVLGQTTSCVAIQEGFAVVPDGFGKIHCFNAKTGKRYWSHDTESQQFGDPLIVDRKVYVGNQDGILTILDLSRTLNVVAKHEMNGVVVTKDKSVVSKTLSDWIIASPVFANGTLYVQTAGMLYAISAKR